MRPIGAQIRWKMTSPPVSLVVITFTKFMVSVAPRYIDEEARGPGAIVEGVPDFKIVVNRDWMADQGNRI